MTYPFGVDVSKWQASQDGTKRMDWNKAVANGIQFAVCRATLGNDYIDPQFAYNWSEMRRLALLRGAYHYFTPLHPLSQINKFVDTVKPQAGERLVLDIEYAGGVSRVGLTKAVKDALELIKSLTGRYPIGYSRAEWLNNNLNIGDLPKIDWWLAQYLNPRIWPLFTPEYDTALLTMPYGVRPEQVKFHQTGEKGDGHKFGAVSYYIDTDRFIGTQAELEAYFGKSFTIYIPIVTVPEPEPEPVLFQARVIADRLIVRDAPAGADTKERRYKGDVVDVYEVNNA